MIIIVYSETNAKNLESNLGFSEYSYYFVLKEFLPLLREIGIVVRVADPATEVDPLYHNALAQGQSCVFLTFTAPHSTVVGLECPTIPVFAWEFDRIPDEIWEDEPRNDWRSVLRQMRSAITHSNFAVDSVRRAMGLDYPVTSIPAPVYDRFSSRVQSWRMKSRSAAVDFDLIGLVIDTDDLDIGAYSPQRIPDPRTAPWPHQMPKAPVTFRIPRSDIVYTSIFNPYDGRKNWFDLISGFCWGLRDCADATLVLKITYYDPQAVIGLMLENLYRLTPFKCRVLFVHAFLDDENYERLADVTTYSLNASHGEGQCLPLMEQMSCGKPAVTPRHSAMIDYIDETNAFIVDSSREPAFWPHDPRWAFRMFQRRLSFQSLVEAYRESYRVAKEEPATYAKMGESARAAMERHCSDAIISERLRIVLVQAAAGQSVLEAEQTRTESAPARVRRAGLP